MHIDFDLCASVRENDSVVKLGARRITDHHRSQNTDHSWQLKPLGHDPPAVMQRAYTASVRWQALGFLAGGFGFDGAFFLSLVCCVA